MIIRQTALYEQFRCAGGSCPDTCCGGWNIDIDEDSLNLYSSFRGSFGAEVKRAVNWKEGCFSQSGGRCRLITPEGLCSLQVRYGEDALCDTCRMYPRHCEEYPGVQEYSVGLSCPEAVRLLLTMEEPLRETETSSDERENWSEEELEDFDEELFALLQKEKKTLLSVLDKQNLSLQTRFRMFLSMAHKLQSSWDAQDFSEPETGEENRNSSGSETGEENRNSSDQEAGAGNWDNPVTDTECYRWKKQVYDVLMDLSPVRNSWSQLLRRLGAILFTGEDGYLENYHAYQNAISEKREIQMLTEQAYRRILEYSVLLYLEGAAYDGWIFSRASLGVFFVSALEDLLILRYREQGTLPDNDTISCCLCALLRETEHQDENLNLLLEFMDKN